MTDVKAEEILGKGDYEYALPFYGEPRPMLIDMANKPDPALEARYNNIKRQENGSLVGEAYTPKLKGGVAYLLGSASALYDSGGKLLGSDRIHTRHNRSKACRGRAAKVQGGS